jgi:hypothetical protein
MINIYQVPYNIEEDKFYSSLINLSLHRENRKK